MFYIGMFSFSTALRKKGPYSELFWSVFSLIRTEYQEILYGEPFRTLIIQNFTYKGVNYFTTPSEGTLEFFIRSGSEPISLI